jgi:hypothetical protein
MATGGADGKLLVRTSPGAFLRAVERFGVVNLERIADSDICFCLYRTLLHVAGGKHNDIINSYKCLMFGICGKIRERNESNHKLLMIQ